MPLPPLNSPTLKKAILTKYYVEDARCMICDLCGIFRTTTDGSAPPAVGLIGPSGLSSFSVPTVERALAEMERNNTGAPMTASESDSEDTQARPARGAKLFKSSLISRTAR